jgi:hypothetical protein
MGSKQVFMLLFRHNRRLGATAALALSVIVPFSGCNVSSWSGDECGPGQSRCLDRNTLEVCLSQTNDAVSWGPLVWKQVACATGAGQSCITADNGVAFCGDPTTRDPQCGSATQSQYCSDAGNVVKCENGYRIDVASCPDSCVRPGPAEAICVPRDAYLDPVCTQGDGTRCKDTSMVICESGYVVHEDGCRTCEVPSTPAEIPAKCPGHYGAACNSPGDCRGGLACHTDSTGKGICTVACAPASDAAAPEAGGAVPNSDCLVPQGDGGVFGLHFQNPPTFCVDGYCR